MLEMENTANKFKIGKVEEMKKLFKSCKELFPLNTKHPELGEIIFVVRQGNLLGCSKEQIKAAGNWWLWARTLFIENTMTGLIKKTMRILALNAAKNNQPIHLVTTRSPELIHAQISTQGDQSLPRSKIALRQLSGLIRKSSEFLPTIGTVLLADVAIDNLETILKICPDLEGITKENLVRLKNMVNEDKLSNISITRLSELPHPSGRSLGDLVNADGTVNVKIAFSLEAERKILTASKESLESHRRMFGWTQEQSEKHNRNLAKTMALVGQAVKIMQPPAIFIHNEAFISRGALNNLLIDPHDPLPIICLTTLLEAKKQKTQLR